MQKDALIYLFSIVKNDATWQKIVLRSQNHKLGNNSVNMSIWSKKMGQTLKLIGTNILIYILSTLIDVKIIYLTSNTCFLLSIVNFRVRAEICLTFGKIGLMVCLTFVAEIYTPI